MLIPGSDGSPHFHRQNLHLFLSHMREAETPLCMLVMLGALQFLVIFLKSGSSKKKKILDRETGKKKGWRNIFSDTPDRHLTYPRRGLEFGK